MGNRVAADVELEGLDIPEMGALAYPDFVLIPTTATAAASVAVAHATGAVPQAALKPVQG
jgi:hypothetical protein